MKIEQEVHSFWPLPYHTVKGGREGRKGELPCQVHLQAPLSKSIHLHNRKRKIMSLLSGMLIIPFHNGACTSHGFQTLQVWGHFMHTQKQNPKPLHPNLEKDRCKSYLTVLRPLHNFPIKGSSKCPTHRDCFYSFFTGKI